MIQNYKIITNSLRDCEMTIRSHYVPQFYLKNFGNPIYFYDKTTDQVTESNPRNLALKKDFYGPTEENKSHPLESAMSDLEGNANIAITKIIDTLNYSRLSEKEKIDFCSFVALQYLRTLEARTRILQLSKKVVDEVAKAQGIHSPKIERTKEEKTGAHLDMMKEFGQIAAVLGKMGILVCSNSTEIPLWTSDNPVNLHNDHDQFPFGNLGVVSKGIEIHIPLSPIVKVAFFDPLTYTKDMLPELFLMEEENVIHSNHLQTSWSTRFMYSNTDKFFMADKYLKANPESKNVDRERLGKGIHELTFEDFKGKEFHERPEFWMDPSELDKFRDES